MAKIHRLPEIVQNKIAAGEVVERPASVVKELVENAIDAGAKSIQVDLEAGGHRLIRVTDDGGGMAPEDLELAVERHATSKITDVEDIFRISTLGFRGEALPSIASVSRLKIVSGLPGESLASSLTVEGGNSLGVAPAPPRPGTLVEVRDIFFNTPARRKFLKSPVSENAKAAEILTRLALAHPEIAFRLDLNSQISFSVQPVASQRERLRELFGQEKTAAVLDLKHQAEGITLTGLVAPPPESRPNSAHIFILVNRRAIRHVGLVQVIRQAYRASLPPRRYPFVVVNLAIDPERLDVNVHPGKEEIRFDNEERVKSILAQSLRQTLRLPDLPGTVLLGPSPAASSQAFYSAPPSASPPDLERLGGGISRLTNSPGSRLPWQKPRQEQDLTEDWHPAPPRGASPLGLAPPASPSPRSPAAPVASAEGQLFLPGGIYRLLGQLAGRYIVVDGPDGLYLIDPHAFHERLNFDQLRQENPLENTPSRLLVPLEMSLSPVEAAILPEVDSLLRPFGFQVALLEANRLKILAIPSFLPPSEAENLFRECLANPETSPGNPPPPLAERRERLTASLACHSAVQLGKSLPPEVLSEIMTRLLQDGPASCPHGRPTLVHLGLSEIDRRFGR